MSTPKIPQEAALAAAQAKLCQLSLSDSGAAPAATSSLLSPRTPLFGPSSCHTEKEEHDLTKNCNRLLYRGIVRDNSYKDSDREVENGDADARQDRYLGQRRAQGLPAQRSNNLSGEKLLSVNGGHEYLIALGFRTKTVDFI
ncbi:hypothetical protein IAR50_003713 [Cryptococcus sp. DSM 104548]